MAVEQFRPWRRPGMTSLAATPASFDKGRLKAGLPVSLSDGGTPTAATATFVLSGPGDVRGLAGRAVRVRTPSPGNTNAESTTVAFVELGDPDLPWRYTPQVNPAGGAGGLRPWLVLVVGVAASEVAVHGDRVRIVGSLLAQHDLAKIRRLGARARAPRRLRRRPHLEPAPADCRTPSTPPPWCPRSASTAAPPPRRGPATPVTSTCPATTRGASAPRPTPTTSRRSPSGWRRCRPPS